MILLITIALSAAFSGTIIWSACCMLSARRKTWRRCDNCLTYENDLGETSTVQIGEVIGWTRCGACRRETGQEAFD
jgi:hypothetical protein